jgi:hypothetical protein
VQGAAQKYGPEPFRQYLSTDKVAFVTIGKSGIRMNHNSLALWYVASFIWTGYCSADVLTMAPTTPTASDIIVFTSSYEDPGYAFDGATIMVSGSLIGIVYRQTGYAGFPPAIQYFSRNVGPLQAGHYTAQVFAQHRNELSDPYGPPHATSSALLFTVRAVPATLEYLVHGF